MTREPEITPSPAAADAAAVFARFVELIARLRAPGGCPWDREQTHESVKPLTIEEAYEVAHAIDEKDDGELAAELGDLLLQVVFHANIAEERGAFRLREIIERVSEKMIRRHPHVFGGDDAATSGEVLRNWEAIKAEERAQKGKDDASMLDSVHKGLPAVMEAFQLTTKVSRVGFDWKDAGAALDEAGRGGARAAARPCSDGGGPRARSPRRSATCCSWPSTSRGSPASTPRARSRRPTASSGAASATSRSGCARTDASRPTRRSRRWTASGTRRRAWSARNPAARDGVEDRASCPRAGRQDS